MFSNKVFNNNKSFFLVLVNTFIFVLQAVIPGFTKMFVLSSNMVLQKPWTLLTTMFLHGNFSHLLFNMYALILFGPLVERKIGSKRFLFAYFLSGIVASFAALYYPSALGASGAIMGIIGLVIMLFPDLKVLFFFIVPMSMRTAGIIFALIDVFGFFAGSSGVAHLAHLAGLSVGLIYGYYLIYYNKATVLRRGSKNSFFAFKKYFSKNDSRSSFKSRKSRSNDFSSYEETIELTKDDLDNFYKYGRL